MSEVMEHTWDPSAQDMGARSVRGWRPAWDTIGRRKQRQKEGGRGEGEREGGRHREGICVMRVYVCMCVCKHFVYKEYSW